MTADDGAVSDENAASHEQTAYGRDAASEHAVSPASAGEIVRPAPNLVLVGPPGAGKSTIGRKLARELGVELYDTDAGIEERTGR
ncbi:shikimate kinase, partial [Nocardia concava]|uniref:shikimate kinase n=1 Tax=Nocardia concava TaxID=257281 RepID=UPI000594FA46